MIHFGKEKEKGNEDVHSLNCQTATASLTTPASRRHMPQKNLIMMNKNYYINKIYKKV